MGRRRIRRRLAQEVAARQVGRGGAEPSNLPLVGGDGPPVLLGERGRQLLLERLLVIVDERLLGLGPLARLDAERLDRLGGELAPAGLEVARTPGVAPPGDPAIDRLDLPVAFGLGRDLRRASRRGGRSSVRPSRDAPAGRRPPPCGSSRARERLELVVVAAGAGRASAPGRPREVVRDHVVELVEPVLLRVGRLVVPGAEPVDSRWRSSVSSLASGSSSPASCSRTKRS